MRVIREFFQIHNRGVFGDHLVARFGFETIGQGNDPRAVGEFEMQPVEFIAVGGCRGAAGFLHRRGRTGQRCFLRGIKGGPDAQRPRINDGIPGVGKSRREKGGAIRLDFFGFRRGQQIRRGRRNAILAARERADKTHKNKNGRVAHIGTRSQRAIPNSQTYPFLLAAHNHSQHRLRYALFSISVRVRLKVADTSCIRRGTRMAADAPKPPPRRVRFQVHLSTAIVLMFAAGGLMWANMCDATMVMEIICQMTMRAYGWPLTARLLHF